MYSVMLIDDEEIIRLELRRFINWEEYGFYIIDEARNGHEALTRFGENAADLVITDIKMPKIDGIEFLRDLKEKGYSSCVVFLSGYSDFEYAKQGLVLGAFDYILKPVEPQKVIEVLKRVKKFLDDKKIEKENNIKLLQKLNEEIRFYYPEDKEKLIKGYVEQGDDKALCVSEVVANELFDILKSDRYGVGMVLNKLISNLTKGILERYGFLSKLADFERSADINFLDIDNRDDIIKRFVKAISELVDYIRKYDLNQKDNIVNKICEYVLQNVDEDITLKSVSDKFFMSKNYICYLFKQKTGENFLEYLTRVKMERAKVLLKEDNLKAYEVSNLLGYRETAYFSKLFKKYTGYSPTEYRKNVLEN